MTAEEISRPDGHAARDYDPGRVQFVQSGRPKFFTDPVNDQLLAMVMALLGEVCTLRERLDTHERVSRERGLWSADDVERFRPDETAEQERLVLREGAMARVLSVLNEEVARVRAEAGSANPAPGQAPQQPPANRPSKRPSKRQDTP